jgi:hypothetical protein
MIKQETRLARMEGRKAEEDGNSTHQYLFPEVIIYNKT